MQNARPPARPPTTCLSAARLPVCVPVCPLICPPVCPLVCPPVPPPCTAALDLDLASAPTCSSAFTSPPCAATLDLAPAPPWSSLLLLVLPLALLFAQLLTSLLAWLFARCLLMQLRQPLPSLASVKALPTYAVPHSLAPAPLLLHLPPLRPRLLPALTNHSSFHHPTCLSPAARSHWLSRSSRK
jgi:hypothetical protein